MFDAKYNDLQTYPPESAGQTGIPVRLDNQVFSEYPPDGWFPHPPQSFQYPNLCTSG